MVISSTTRRGLTGGNGDDILTGIAQSTSSQIHIYARGGDDIVRLDFAADISGFAFGHHARGDANGSTNRGADVFDFVNTHRVGSGTTVVGRLEDFGGEDELRIDGVPLDFDNLPETVRIVEFNGAHDDPGALPQQWIVIQAQGGGTIFYALEGARIDMDGTGGANGGAQEAHFVGS